MQWGLSPPNSDVLARQPHLPSYLLQLSRLLSKWATPHLQFQEIIRTKYQVRNPPYRHCQVNSFPASSFPPLTGYPRLPAFTPCHRPSRVQRPISREHYTFNRWRNPGRSSRSRARPSYFPRWDRGVITVGAHTPRSRTTLIDPRTQPSCAVSASTRRSATATGSI